LVRKVTAQTSTPFSICDKISLFEQFGEGIYLYFFFLKYFAIVFGIMALISLPIVFLSLSWSASGFKGDQNYFVKMSLSNFLRLELNDTDDQDTIDLKSSNYQRDSKNFFYIFQGLDLVYTFIFWVSVLVFRYFIAKKTSKIQTKTVSVQKYSLQVNNLPKGSTLSELKKFFEQFGKVVAINGAFNMQSQLPHIKKLAQLIINKRKLKKQGDSQKELDKNELKMDALALKIRKNIKLVPSEKLDFKEFSHFRIIQAYVIFEEFSAMQSTYHAFKKEYRKYCCFSKKKDPRFYFKGHKLSLSVPDLPSNINWNNIGYPFIKKFFRFLFMVLIIAIILLVTALLVLGFTSVRESSKSSLRSSGDSCVEKLSFESFSKIENPSEEIVYCFCVHQDKISIVNNADIKQTCMTFLTEQALVYAKQIGAAAMISFLDVFFALVISKLTSFFKITNKSKEIAIQVILISIVMYFNTFILQLFIFAEVNNHSFRTLMEGSPIYEYIPEEQYASMNRAWFSHVGAGIIFTMVIKIVNPAIFNFLLALLKR
jgi:hypothetical protein